MAAVPVVVFSAAGREGLHDAAALRATAVLPKPLDLDVLSAVLEHVLSDARRYQPHRATTSSDEDLSGPVQGPSVGGASASPPLPAELSTGEAPAAQGIGTCPVCAQPLYADIDDSLSAPARIKAIYAVRRTHVLSHSAHDIAQVPLRMRLLQMPIGQRRILADWVYRELRHHWGDADRRAVHSVDETLGSVALHRLWQDAIRCAYPTCPHGQ